MIQTKIESDGTLVMWDDVKIIFYTLWFWCVRIPPYTRGDGCMQITPFRITRGKCFYVTPRNYFTVH